MDQTTRADDPKTHTPLPDGRPLPVVVALIPVVALVSFLALFILILPHYYPGFEGSGHIPLILAACVAGLLARLYGWRWPTINAGIQHAIFLSMGAILILITIGGLIGTWIASGIVPALISWGLSLLRPSYFLAACCVVCSVVSVVSGSSWSTAGTVGLALLGVGGAMGIDPAMTAGAVISGAYFGDKLSPLSDTTNLAPAMAGTDLFTHVRHMLWTTVPSWVLALVGYTLITLTLRPMGDLSSLQDIQAVLHEHFQPGLVHLIVPGVVLALVLKRMPALPTLVLATALGGALAALRGTSIADVFSAAMAGYQPQTGNEVLDALLQRGGMSSMFGTVFLILCAMVFGGVMERTGILRVLAAQLLRRAQSTGSLIAATILTAIGTNIITADQYISLVIPGRMYQPAFRARGLHMKNLSRALEDGGTITSPLIPWNTCGAFMSATLGVPTAQYAFYAFLNLLNPLIGTFYGFTGISIARADPEETVQA